jgi:hypothetical protein
MKAARELAEWVLAPFVQGDATTILRALTAAIEARDREHAAALSVAREALERMSQGSYPTGLLTCCSECNWQLETNPNPNCRSCIARNALARLDGLTIQEVSNAERD